MAETQGEEVARKINPPGTWSAPDRLPDGLVYEEEEGGVVVLRLDRPDRLNALTFDIYEGLRDVFAQLASKQDARSVILTGTGHGFCSGGDVEDIIGALFAFDEKGLHAFTTLTCDVVANMRRAPQPIVAALNGTVAGAGAALAVASDLRVAVPSAKISFLFTKVGLSGADMGACHLLPRLIGLGRATELLLLGDPLPAEEAHKSGLYNRLVEPDALMDNARELAQRLAQGPRMGLFVTKETLDAQSGMELEEALEWDARVQAECMTHPDFREAYEAFKEKRKPAFQ
jgi:enoyl-CoA hydratase/carnithine racemase